MAKTLVLAEKPSVGRDIARVLGCKQRAQGCLIGDEYIVTWAIGHLVALASPEELERFLVILGTQKKRAGSQETLEVPCRTIMCLPMKNSGVSKNLVR